MSDADAAADDDVTPCRRKDDAKEAMPRCAAMPPSRAPLMMMLPLRLALRCRAPPRRHAERRRDEAADAADARFRAPSERR